MLSTYYFVTIELVTIESQWLEKNYDFGLKLGVNYLALLQG